MKSIKEYKQNKSKYTFQNILGQSLWYARNCVLSVSLMSGFGLPWNYDQVRIDEWINVLKSKDIKHITPENIILLRAVYKKGDPHYSNAYNGNRNDYQNFLWDDSSFKKIITPSSQSYLIMDEIMLAKYLYKYSNGEITQSHDIMEKKITALLLIKSAMMQAQFMSNYLRNNDGLFVSKLDKSKSPYGEPELEEIDGSPTVSEQALAMQSFSMLAHILNDKDYPLFENIDCFDVNKKFAQEILTMFLDSSEDIFCSKTKELCDVISSCIEYYKIEPGNNDILNYITRLSLELESRVDMSGNLVRFPDENTLTSNSSSFIALKALIQSYKTTDIYKFLNCAEILYKKLDLLWNPSCCLYALDGDDKYTYTLRDVGSVIGGLNSIRIFGEEQFSHDAENKLLLFFNSAINTSGLIRSSSSPPSADDYEGYLNCCRNNTESVVYEDFCSPDIPSPLEVGVAPVFAKKFTFKYKKSKFNINSDSFYSDYALFTTNEMLYMSLC